GNVIKVTDPRGQDTQFIFNALDQLVRRMSREVTAGSGVRYQLDLFYDANNNVRRIDTQNFNELGQLQTNTHFTTSAEYEILNNPIRISEEVDTSNSIFIEYGYDGNRNRTLVRFGEAASGRQPNNVTHLLYDERDLTFR